MIPFDVLWREVLKTSANVIQNIIFNRLEKLNEGFSPINSFAVISCIKLMIENVAFSTLYCMEVACCLIDHSCIVKGNFCIFFINDTNAERFRLFYVLLGLE